MAWVILIPVGGGALLFLLRGRAQTLVSMATGAGTLAAVCALTAKLWREGPQTHAVGGWPAPLGIQLYADGLSVMMLMMTAIVGVAVTMYSVVYFGNARPTGSSSSSNDPHTSHDPAWNEGAIFWPLSFLLWAGLNALFVSSDIFNVYVVLEVVTLAAVALAILSGDADALRAGLRYLLAGIIGSMAYLMGVALVYGASDTLDIRTLAATTHGPSSALALALMTAGLLLKTALFPLHFWLPPAHSAAPAPVSALLSGVVVKGSFYILLRLWFEVFERSLTFSAGQFLGALGAAAVFWGSFQAIRQQRLKLLIAHSTVGQIGYLFLLFPLLTADGGGRTVPWYAETWSGGVYQALSHGLAKAAMFLAAGVIVRAVGSDHISAMRDIASRLPVVAFALGLAGMSLIGLPPSGGFVAKWMLIKAIIASGQWWWLPAMVIGALLTTGYVSLMLRHTFVPAEKQLPLQPVPMTLQLSALFLALAAVAIGFRLEEPLAMLKSGTLFSIALEPATTGGAP
jgi:multicomponent Na+:H+ antiporter subunit D